MAGKYAIETVFRLIDNMTRPLSRIDNQANIVNRSLKNMYHGAEKAAARAGGAFKRMAGSLGGVLGLSAAFNADKLIGFATQDIRNAMQFSDTMARISNLIDTAKVPLTELQHNFTAAANAGGFAAQEISKIALAAIGSGVAAEDSARFAGVVAKTAKVTGTQTNAIVDALTGVMNAYGLSGAEASRVSGLMLIANNKGKTSIEEMTKSFRQVIPRAKQFGVNMDDIFAAIAALTSKGETTKDAMKLTGDAISKIAHPSKEAASLAKKLGIDFSEAALRGKGFSRFIDDISKKTGGNRKVLETLFGGEDIGRIMGILATTGKSAFDDALARMTFGAETIVDDAFEKITNTPQERWNKAMNKIHNTSIQIGAALIPVIDKIIDKVNEIAGNISRMDLGEFTKAASGAFSVMYALFEAFTGAVKIAWHFRGVLMLVAGALGFYYGVAMLVAGTGKIIALAMSIKSAAILATTMLFGKQTAALALLKGSELSYLLLSKLFAGAALARTAILGVLTGGTLAQTAATAAQATAAGTVTAAQWALNAAMTANPVGLIIAGVAALIGFIVLLVKNIDYVIALFKSLGDIILLALLKPFQMILELIDLIPGVNLVATKTLRNYNGDAADRISERFSKVKENRAAKRAANEEAELQKITGDNDAIMKYYSPTNQTNIPNMNTPEYNVPDVSAGMGKALVGRSKLHGVIDTSGAIAEGGVSGALTETVSTAQSNVSYSGTLAQKTANFVSNSDILTKKVIGIFNAVSRIDACVRTMTRGIGGDAPSENGEGAARSLAPVTHGERVAYSLQERRETVKIEINAAAGSEARVTKAPRAFDIRLTHSGSNV